MAHPSDAAAFEDDKRVLTASFDLGIPHPKVSMTVSFSQAWFTAKGTLYEHPDMLPVIIK